MYTHIEIRGLGPHTHTALNMDAAGCTSFTGPSEAGKSTVIDAICFAMWGQGRTGKALDVRAIRDGCDEVRVDLTLRSGTTLTRTLTKTEKGRGKTFRQMTKRDGSTHEYRTEKDWLGALKWMGGKIDVLRTILVPLAWLPLTFTAGGGREFRNLLNEALPTIGTKREIIAEIMNELGFELGPHDPINQTDAIDLRRRCRQHLERAKGKLVGLEESRTELDETEVKERPDAASVAESIETLRVEKAWAAGDAGRARALESGKAVYLAWERAGQWDARLAALGDRPADEANLDALGKARDSANRRAREAVKTLDTLERERSDLEDAVKPRQVGHPPRHMSDSINRAKRRQIDAQQALEAVSDVCPTCQRPGWDGALAAVQREASEAAEAVAAAEAEFIREQERLVKLESERAEKAKARLDAIGPEVKTAKEAVKAADERVSQATMQLADASSSPGVQWDRERKALGRRPPIPAEVPAPPEPSSPRPPADLIAQAKAVLADHEHADGAARQLREDIAMVERQIATAGGEIAELTIELERLEALVAAVRREPSESVRRQLGALGDLGPVTLELNEKGGAAVLVDGRPWHLASTGRQVVADVWLRTGLRRAAKAPKLPLFIDCTQDVGGQILPRPVPCITLTTTNDHALAAASEFREAS